MNSKTATRITGVFGGIFALSLCFSLHAQEEEYLHIANDLGQGLELQEVSDRAYENANEYWEFTHGHERDDHDHEAHDVGTEEYDTHDGIDELLSAGEAVTSIYKLAPEQGNVDRLALDIVEVTIAVIDSWPDCQDTFDAVRAAVELEPSRADEIVAKVSVKRDCNCNNGGLWLDQRVHDRIRVDMRHSILDVPVQCSCSQVAMYAGIAGLPENREFNPDLSDEEKAILIDSMTERVEVITDRTSAMQSNNNWQCGCTDINIAAAMQGIADDELRDGAYDGLAEKYVEDAADRGLVVDSFGIVGLYPEAFWGDNELISRNNVLRRKTEVFRGDNLILDPFHPTTEFTSHGDHNLGHLDQHAHTSGNIPTDLFISEYVEGWNEEALKVPVEDRDPDQRNRVLELYNGGDETIDLGNDQYLLEIYAADAAAETTTVVTPPVLVKKTISLQSDVTFDFDRSEIKPVANDELKQIIKVLNQYEFFSELLISGHTCDLGSDDYNVGLSERRANSVNAFLKRSGLRKDIQVRTEGRGETEPRLPNISKTNRSRNRRVDISFVIRQDADIESSVSKGSPTIPKKYAYSFPSKTSPAIHAVENEAAGSMAAGEYTKGDMDPRQVIGLNGAIEPGETWIIAFDQSDDSIKDLADEVTGQLDFKPNETLVIRRLGGEMALSCRASAYSYTTNYPPQPLIRSPDPSPPPRDAYDEVASPN